MPLFPGWIARHLLDEPWIPVEFVATFETLFPTAAPQGRRRLNPAGAAAR
jgi:hypothetical protein